MYSKALSIVTCACAWLGAGCGLVDPNITNFDLSLPDRTFTVDTAQWELAGGQMPSVPCDADPTICDAAIQDVCAGNPPQDQCAGACVASACELAVAVARHTEVDLFNEKPELKTIEDQPLIDVEIDRVQYEVTENTFTVDTPEILVFVAPQSVMSPESPEARPVGVIAPVPAGTRQDVTDLAFSDTGRATLREFMSDFKTPFNILVASQVRVQPGDPMPEGRIEARLSVSAHAGL